MQNTYCINAYWCLVFVCRTGVTAEQEISKKERLHKTNNCFSKNLRFGFKRLATTVFITQSKCRSNAIYKYLYHNDSVYVDKMSQQLEEQIPQHVPKSIRSKIRPQKNLPRR